jgi:tripartite-type tricarboxylate transporter receptor subunit TctC
MKRLHRRGGITFFLVAAFAIIVAVHGAFAADFPSTVSIVVAFPAGGGADVQARMLAKGLAERLGHPVVVDNRPGAGGRIGATFAAHALADGNTLFFASLTTLVIEPVIRLAVGYDAERDFVPVTLVSEEPFFLVVSPSLPVKNVAELITYSRNHPLSYASFGLGSSAHLVGESFKAAAKVDILHVPYKGAVPAIVDVMGGHVSMMFANALTAIPQIRSGKVRALAITGPTRLNILPEVPTLAESGVAGVDLKIWYGFVVPAKTPSEIVARLHKELTELIKGREFETFVQNSGAHALPSSPKEMSQRIQSDSATVRELVRKINFRAED